MSKLLKPGRLSAVRILSLVVFVHAIPVFAQPAPIVVTVDECLPPLTAAFATASGPRPDGACSYFWTLGGGVITGGQNSDTLQFESGPPGTPITISAEAVGPAGCFGFGHATSRTGPVASASGEATICRGYSTPLAGSGGTSCEWFPAQGLSDPQSCTPLASPTRTTFYSLTVTDTYGCSSSDDAGVRITVPFEPPDSLSVDPSLPPDTPGLTASARGDCSGFTWTLQGGTITAGQGTRVVTFTSGLPGTRLAFKAVPRGQSFFLLSPSGAAPRWISLTFPRRASFTKTSPRSVDAASRRAAGVGSSVRMLPSDATRQPCFS